MLLIGLAGPARSGKDTVALFLQAQGFDQYAFADPIKAGVRAMFHLTWDHTDGDLKETVLPGIGKSPRQLMQTLGTEWGRQHVAGDLWIRLAHQQWYNTQLLGERQRAHGPIPGGHLCLGLVVSDVRFADEADWIRSQGGQVWHIRRPDALGVSPHASESGVAMQTGDIEIHNTGTLTDLQAVVDQLVEANDA